VIIFFIYAIDILTRLFIFIAFVYILLSYFMSPFHPIRTRIDRIIEPILNPIRRIIPTVGMVDFSPLILILLVQVVSLILRNVLRSLL